MITLPRSNMSREGRDTLWLLGVLTLCVLPHLGRLPLWCSLGTAAAIVWRGRVAWRDSALPPRWFLLVCLAVCMVATLLSFKTLFGREAGVTLVTLLAGLKTLELRARRDAFVVTSLGFFLILTQFLYSQSLGIAFVMLLVVIGLLTSLVLAQRPTGRPPIWMAVKAACRSAIMGIPVMVALFVLFPRLGPLWSVPADARQHTGLSDRIKLGNVSDLAQDDSIAMRIKFFGAPPSAKNLYFRGPVLDVFDGRTWHARANVPQLRDVKLPEKVEFKGAPVMYQITLEPSQISTLPLLEGTLDAVPTPPATEPQLSREGLNWTTNSALTDRAQIDARAWQDVRVTPQNGLGALRLWLQLPFGLNPRSLKWAAEFRAQPQLRGADARTLSNAVLKHIAQNDYRYTLTPGEDSLDDPAQPPRNLIDEFWMDRRTGFCEHFATAYVVVMRAMGVPSRVVTGFQGLGYNPVDGLFVVRNSDAHAWAEFWQDDQGWVRVDPTAAVAPERIERPRQTFRNRNPLPGPLSNIDPAVWGKVRDYMDAGNHRWNVWVLQYSRNRQMDMLKNMGFSSPNWLDLIRLAGGMMVGISMLGIVWLWWTRPRTRKTPWRRPLMRVHRALQACGLPVPTESPPPAAALSWLHALDRVPTHEKLAPIKQELQATLAQLDALRYAPHTNSKREAGQQRTALVERIEQLGQSWKAVKRRIQAN